MLRDITGSWYVYTNKSGNPFVAYSHALGKDIPDNCYYEDEAGETTELDALLSTVKEGDGVIVGSVTDFMTPSVQDMTNTLYYLEEKGVHVFSRLEPNYDAVPYRDVILFANNIARKILGYKPE